jgi:hypothetical protein
MVIPVPAAEIVRADQNTMNAGFLHNLTGNLHRSKPGRRNRLN